MKKWNLLAALWLTAAPALAGDKEQECEEGPISPEKMQIMQQRLDKISQTRDPAERQKLMRENLQAMQESAKTLRASGVTLPPGMDQMQDMMKKMLQLPAGK